MEAGGVEAGSHGAKYECLLFDMDDTLYPMSSGLNLACRKNIEEFMLHRLGMEESEVPRMCLELYREYGTTMAGLKDLGYEFDNDEFHAYVHGRLPYEALKPDPLLRNLLLSMPQRKIIFTNADKTHAAIVLSKLGLEDCFEGVICFETLNPPPPVDDASSVHHTNGDGVADDNNKVAGESNQALTYKDATTDLVVAASVDHTNGVADDNNEIILESDEALMYRDATNDLKNSKNVEKMMVQQIICKPSITAMQAAIRIANVDPNKTIFFDDSARNIATAKLAGLHTVIVGSSNLVPGADHVSSIHNIKEALPQIWEREEEHLDQIIQSTVQTVVLA